MELGRRGWGKVHPNPMVGCVLVKDGRTIAEGWHEEVGGPHAEVNALANASEDPLGATAYVSLEPCNHVGRTPPCTRALQEAGIARVVYGASDPGQKSGGGGTTLQAAGIEVLGPVLSMEEARRENPAFFHNQQARAPFVAIKLAQTLDGMVAGGKGQRTAITGAEAKRETHRLRAGFDGVMVGSGTLRVDNPVLTVREDVPYRAQPTRILLDSGGFLRPDAAVFRDIQVAPVLVFTGPETPQESISAWEARGAAAVRVHRTAAGLDLVQVLGHCWKRNITAIFCEGGARLASQLLIENLAHRLYLFLAPFVLGRQGVPAFTEKVNREHWDSWRPAQVPCLFGRDALHVLDRMV